MKQTNKQTNKQTDFTGEIETRRLLSSRGFDRASSVVGNMLCGRLVGCIYRMFWTRQMQVKRRVKTRQTTDGTRTSPTPVVLVKRVRFDRYSTSPESVRALMKRISISLTGFYRFLSMQNSNKIIRIKIRRFRKYAYGHFVE